MGTPGLTLMKTCLYSLAQISAACCVAESQPRHGGAEHQDVLHGSHALMQTLQSCPVSATCDVAGALLTHLHGGAEHQNVLDGSHAQTA